MVVVMGFRWCSLMTVALMLYYSLLRPEGLRFLSHTLSSHHFIVDISLSSFFVLPYDYVARIVDDFDPELDLLDRFQLGAKDVNTIMVSRVAGSWWLERVLSTKAQSSATCLGLALCNPYMVTLSLHQFPMTP